MSVTFLRPYGNFATGVVGTFADDVELAMIAQGIAVAGPITDMSNMVAGQSQSMTQGGNVSTIPQGSAGYGTPTYLQGSPRLPVINLGSAALTGYETNGVAQTAGTFNLVEIYVPYLNTWTGIGVLNGTTVATNKYLVALWGTSGALLANSAVAGVTTATASVMQNVPFTSPITLVPGRYIIGVQLDGATDTVRHLLAANGSNVATGTVAGTFGTVPATITVPSTFTTAVGPIAQLYT